MQQRDSLQRFIFENSDIRGVVVRLNQTFQTIMHMHQYPRAVFNALAETLMTSVLLRSTLKFNGELTVQLQNDGPIKLLVAKCNEHWHLRGLAQFTAALEEGTAPTQGFMGGNLVVTVGQEGAKYPYQSIIPLTHPSIAENIEHYYGQSVQIPTKVWLAVNEHSAAGMLLQLLPAEKQSAQEREQFWTHAVKLGETLTEKELLTLDNETLLYRLYHQEKVRLYGAEVVSFQCRCSQQHMENIVKMLGKEEIEAILAEKQVVDIGCEYCNNHYCFDRVDVARIFHS